jgi:hypothetical protein
MGIYGICNIIIILLFGPTQKNWVWINQPKNVWNENLKMAHLTHLAIFHLKMIVCQNVSLPHTYDRHPQKQPFVIW